VYYNEGVALLLSYTPSGLNRPRPTELTMVSEADPARPDFAARRLLAAIRLFFVRPFQYSVWKGAWNS
jgi:hypothetical protein